MTDAETCWIKNPLAIYTANTLDAGGGVVTQGSQIVEVVAKLAVDAADDRTDD